jgi:hypothetical protein
MCIPLIEQKFLHGLARKKKVVTTYHSYLLPSDTRDGGAHSSRVENHWLSFVHSDRGESLHKFGSHYQFLLDHGQVALKQGANRGNEIGNCNNGGLNRGNDVGNCNHVSKLKKESGQDRKKNLIYLR